MNAQHHGVNAGRSVVGDFDVCCVRGCVGEGRVDVDGWCAVVEVVRVAHFALLGCGCVVFKGRHGAVDEWLLDSIFCI